MDVDVAEVLKVEMMREVIDSEVVVLVTTVPVDVEEPRVEVLFFEKLRMARRSRQFFRLYNVDPVLVIE